MAQTPENPHRPIRSMYADDPEMADLVETFVGEMPARLEALRAAWAEREIQGLRRLAHQLKGACSGYGFPTVGRAAQEFEDRLRGVDASAEESLREMTREFEALMELCTRACNAQPR